MILVVILSALVPPMMARASDHSDLPICAPNLRKLWIASAQYAADHEGRLPPVGNSFRNYAMMYFAGDTQTGGFTNLTLLFTEGYLEDGRAALFCPLNRTPMFQDSHGRSDHMNFYASLHPDLMAQFGYGNYRSSFIRRPLPEAGETRSQGALIDAFPEKAWLTDVFSTPSRVLESHMDSVNVLYGNGSVRQVACDPYVPPFSQARFGDNDTIMDVWEELDQH